MSEHKNIKRDVFKVRKMSCASCAANIEKNLQKKEGVIEASMNFAAEKLQVTFDNTKIQQEEIISLIEGLGYGVDLEEAEKREKVVLKVGGMSCAVCAGNIEKALNDMAGIYVATVNFAAEKVTLEYNPQDIRLAHIKKRITDLGYTLTQEEDQEQIDADEKVMFETKKTMLLSVLLTSIVMGLMMVHMFIVHIPGYLAIAAIIALPNIFGAGLHVHKASLKALKNKSPNMDVLVTLGSVPPYMIGLLGFFIPVTTFIEMATTIVTFHLIGKYLEVRAKGRASKAIKKLIEMGAKTATIVVDNEEIKVPVSELAIGDIMIVRPGDKLPTDGVVVEGSSLVDESMATGEPIPVKREKDDEVIGATINKNGLLKVKVTKVGKDTFLSQVIKMVEECQGSKVPIQAFADRVTGYFVPIIMIITALTFISFNVFSDFHLGIVQWGATFLPWVNADLNPLTLSFITATAVLVIACPCALGLGTPTALMVGSGIGAERGILIRNGEAVQTLKDVKAIAFDKTGTITKGKPEVTDLIALQGVQDKELLYYAASIEKASEHPLAHAIVENAAHDKIALGEVKAFSAIVGKGVIGNIADEKIVVGNRKLMQDYQIDYKDQENRLIALEEEAKTVMMVAKQDALIGIIAVADPIKEDSMQAIEALESMGIETAMITGDNDRTAQAIGRQVGITHVISEVLPDGKVDEVLALQKRYDVVAMVGDGINDAPALKQSNVGIAIGTGTDIAIEAADVTLVRGELSGIVSGIKLSKATFKKIKQNYFWAWFYNAIAIPIAMFGLLHPLIGAAAMSVSSLNVVYNSLRLKRVNIEAK